MFRYIALQMGPSGDRIEKIPTVYYVALHMFILLPSLKEYAHGWNHQA